MRLDATGFLRCVGWLVLVLLVVALWDSGWVGKLFLVACVIGWANRPQIWVHHD